ncbi:hypothetical protein AAVH_30515 [Aphelenchoides avenae]|nr:hypothetical protein AAVH_30515 [Aphelenchus avenae]
MNATTVRTICYQLLLKNTPKEGRLVFGEGCKRVCTPPLRCAKVKGILSPEIYAVDASGGALWMAVLTLATLILLAGIIGWTLAAFFYKTGSVHKKKDKIAPKEEIEMESRA